MILVGITWETSWYQPVLRAHPLATVLPLTPPTRPDNADLQSIIATRRYGKGKHSGRFNETEAVKKVQWFIDNLGQMIYRLGLGRALGQQKRFSPSTDLTTYQTGERVTVTVEAYNSSYENLDVDGFSSAITTNRCWLSLMTSDSIST